MRILAYLRFLSLIAVWLIASPISAQSGGGGGGSGSGSIPGTCDDPTHPDYEVLARFFNATGGPQWKNNSDWLNCDVCTWYGITCNSGRVTEINLEDNNLDGDFTVGPDELSSLKKLDFSDNNLDFGGFFSINGDISLEYLDLANNSLRAMPVLVNFQTNLKYLDLRDNGISANITDHFQNLTNLEHFDLSENEFFGNFPQSISNFSKLKFLDLSDNAISGCIPSSYTNHCDIKNNVFLDGNCNLAMPVFSDWCDGASCSTVLELEAPDESCIGETITINAPPGYDTYSWEGPCVGGSRSQSASNSIIGTCPGTYSVTVTTFKGCELTITTTVNTYREPDQYILEDICEDGEVVVRGNTYNAPGSYTVPQTTSNGCSYNLFITLSEIPRPRRSIYLDICEGFSESVYNTIYSEEGTFLQDHENPVGCDSLLTVMVSLLPTYSSVVNYSVCPGERAEHDGVSYDVGNTPRKYIAENGCDSIVNITVSELPTYSTNVYLEACSGEMAEHDGRFYDFGSDSRTYEAANGCDSIILITTTELFPSNITETYNICNGQEVNVNGQFYTGGTHTQNFINSDGCESILNIIVNETPPYELEEVITMCDGEPVTFEGVTYYSGGTYRPSLVDEAGCNYFVNLEIIEAVRSITEVHIPRCDGENPVYYDGRPFYNSSGTIKYVNAAGCDSLVRVRIHNEKSSEETIVPPMECYPDKVVVNGIEYGSTNTYVQNLTNAAGCDSTLYINVTVNREDRERIEREICPGGSVTVNAETYENPGDYIQFLTTVGGCDSILRIKVVLSDLILEENTVILCGDATHLENGNIYSETGMDEIYFTTSEGCDSLYRLFIEKYENTSEVIYDRLCTGNQLDYNDEIIDAGGTYVQNLTNSNGCDSTLTIVVDEFSPTSSFVNRETCDGVPWIENGVAYIEEGVYEQKMVNAAGCDSIINIDLTVKRNTEEYLPVQLCIGQAREINGVLYDSPMIDVQHLNNAAGCDSTLTIEVTVVDAVRAEHHISLCEGKNTVYNGEFFDETTTVEQYFTAASGCDSILTVYVNVYPHTIGEVQTTVCTGYSTEVNGVFYTKGGIEIQKIQNSRGCDSTITVYIEELSPSISENTFYMCEGDTKFINGEAYEYGGSFEQHYTNAVGCDSTFRIELIEFPDTESREIHFICPGEFVEINDERYSLPGEYTQSFTNSRECDSTLFVDVRYSEPVDTLLFDFICEETVYEWKGLDINGPGDYRFDTLTSRGCDSIIYLTLGYLTGQDTTISRQICKGDFFRFGEKKLYSSGIYFDEIIIGGCKTPTTLHLEVLEPSEGYDAVYICEGGRIWIDGKFRTEAGLYYEERKTKAGCDSLLTIELFVKEHVEVVIDTFLCPGSTINYGNLSYDRPGYFQLKRKTRFGCDSLIRLNIELYDTSTDLINLQVCEGETVEFQGEIFGPGTYEGSYFDGLCEQKYLLEVSTTSSLAVNETKVVCDEDLDFLGQTYVHSGQYLINAEIGECEYIEYLNVIRLEPDNAYDIMFLCEGSSMELEGNTVSEEGSYTIDNCSGEYDLEILFIDGESTSVYKKIFPGEAVVIEGERYQEAGTFVIEVGENSECQTTITLTIEVEACGGERVIYANLCNGESFDFFGEEIKTTGFYEYEKNLGNVGCDSLIKLDISFTEIPAFAILGEEVFCDGDTLELSGPEGYSYLWNNGEQAQSIKVTKSGTYELQLENLAGCVEVATISVTEIKFPSSLQIEIVAPKSCDFGDGQIIVGGTEIENYHFSHDGGNTWQESNEFTGLPAGEYMIMVADPSLTCIRPGITPVKLKNSGIPTIKDISTTDANQCISLGGSISIQVEGSGVMEFSIDGGENWTDTSYFSGLASGIYEVQVSPKESSCVNDFSPPIEIADMGHLEAELIVLQELSCTNAEDGILSVEVIAGAEPYSFDWLNTNVQQDTEELDSLQAGEYTVRITDGNGCTLELTKEIENIDLSASVAAFKDTLICEGDTLYILDLDSSFHYVLFKDDLYVDEGNSFTISEAGHYFVVAERGSECYEQLDFIVEYPDISQTGVDFLMSSKGILDEEIILVNVSDPMPEVYEWIYDTSRVHFEIIDGLSQALTFSDTGRYEISLESEVDGCLTTLTKEIEVFTDTFEIDFNSGNQLDDQLRMVEWSVTPNPNNGEFMVKVALSEPGLIQVGLYDIFGANLGGRLLSGSHQYEQRIALPNLSPGIYSVVLQLGEKIYQKSILVIR